MSFDSPYVWIVICKNHKFHKRQNLFFGHKIPLGETDAYETAPSLEGGIHVRCDECGEEYHYQPKDLMKIELDLPDTFKPHPLFS